MAEGLTPHPPAPSPTRGEGESNSDGARTPYIASVQQIELLESLVAIPSTSGQEAEAAQHLVGWMADHGAREARVDAAGNAVGVFGDGPRQIVLLGHIDTVDGFPSVRRERRLLYGRGTVDAKGPLCTFAAAANATIPDGWQVIVIGAVEEECPTSVGAHFAVTQYAPELCVIGEPSRWDRLTLGYKGRLIAEVEMSVPLSHSAGQGQTAAEAAVSVWGRVREYAAQVNDGRERAFDRLDAALTQLNTGDDGLTGWARMTLGFRLPPGMTPEGLEGELRRILTLTSSPSPTLRGSLRSSGRGGLTPHLTKYRVEAATGQLERHLSLDESISIAGGTNSSQINLPFPEGEGLGVKATFSSHTPAFAAERDTSLSRLFRAAIREHGGTPAFVMKTGTSDMNIAGPAWNCPILAYGPGDSALDHTPHEHVDLDEYLRAIEVLSHVLTHLPTN